jgi:Asp-tRNA(Asn)/Glu-tRNA(Gln) amidotransferase B subunit
MRLKSDAVDYRYFREPNIIEIDITDLLTYVKNQTNVLPTTIKQELMDQKIPLDLINQLLDNYDAYKIFHKVNTAIANPSLVIA